MKTIYYIITLVLLTCSNLAFSHGGDHSHDTLSPERAVKVAQAVSKAMTFKDRGYSAGKLDLSWNKVKKAKYMVVEETHSGIIVKATNPTIKQTLFFKLNSKGKVLDVEEQGDFMMSHGHEH